MSSLPRGAPPETGVDATAVHDRLPCHERPRPPRLRRHRIAPAGCAAVGGSAAEAPVAPGPGRSPLVRLRAPPNARRPHSCRGRPPHARHGCRPRHHLHRVRPSDAAPSGGWRANPPRPPRGGAYAPLLGCGVGGGAKPAPPPFAAPSRLAHQQGRREEPREAARRGGWPQGEAAATSSAEERARTERRQAGNGVSRHRARLGQPNCGCGTRDRHSRSAPHANRRKRRAKRPNNSHPAGT